MELLENNKRTGNKNIVVSSSELCDYTKLNINIYNYTGSVEQTLVSLTKIQMLECLLRQRCETSRGPLKLPHVFSTTLPPCVTVPPMQLRNHNTCMNYRAGTFYQLQLNITLFSHTTRDIYLK